MNIKLDSTKKRFDIFLVCFTITILAFVFLIMLPEKEESPISSNLPEKQSASYLCKATGIDMNCFSLSKTNKFGTQTRCYIISDSVSYKICNKGWIKK